MREFLSRFGIVINSGPENLRSLSKRDTAKHDWLTRNRASSNRAQLELFQWLSAWHRVVSHCGSRTDVHERTQMRHPAGFSLPVSTRVGATPEWSLTYIGIGSQLEPIRGGSHGGVKKGAVTHLPGVR